MTSKNLNPRSTELLTATQMKGLLRLGDVVHVGEHAVDAGRASGLGEGRQRPAAGGQGTGR